MEAWQRVLGEMRGSRSDAEWARQLGIANRQTVSFWFLAVNPTKPSAAHLAAVLLTATADQRDRLLAALLDPIEQGAD